MDTRRSGWVMYAGIVLGLLGVMRAFDSIWAFRYSGSLPDNLEGALFGNNLTTVAWIYLALAVILIVCAVLLLMGGGSQSARWVGLVAACVEVVTAMWYMPYWPVWSLTYVTAGALVIYALAVHGGQHETTAP